MKEKTELILRWIEKADQDLGTAKVNQDDLNQLNELYEKGRIKTVTDRQYPFHEAGQAVAYVEKGHAKGKVVINIKYL